ncbi:hypothetical protein RO22_18250 [Halomonas sp. KHS3]|nr:hypothetical protein RO22_18250 [Halomonas sp. KHS3]
MGCPSFLRYVRAVLAFHLATLMVSFAILLAVTIRIDSGGPYVDEQITPVIARAIIRQDDGQLAARMTRSWQNCARRQTTYGSFSRMTLVEVSHLGRASGRLPKVLPLAALRALSTKRSL